MNITISGLPALTIALAFVSVFTLPVWAAARMVGAGYPTFLRSAAALVVGVALSLLSIAVFGFWSLIASPLAFLMAIRFILDTSFRGAFILTILAAIGMALVVKLFAAGFSVAPTRTDSASVVLGPIPTAALIAS